MRNNDLDYVKQQLAKLPEDVLLDILELDSPLAVEALSEYIEDNLDMIMEKL